MIKPALWMLTGIIVFHLILFAEDAGKVAYGAWFRPR
jgi:hypothetical protein